MALLPYQPKNMEPMIDVNPILTEGPVEASAPCRIDCGGTWDIKAMALPYEAIAPTTVNMALTLRTRVILYPHRPGSVKITSQGFEEEEAHRVEAIPFTSHFGLFSAAVLYFGFHGIQVEIRSESPVKSALGGSSTALVALIQALSNLGRRVGRPPLSRREILHLAYHLEDAISGGNCGMQDQAAAVYGGVHQWVWQYGNRTTPFRRVPLLDQQGREALSRRLLVAYSGKTHTSAATNLDWIEGFVSGRTRSGWRTANRIVQQLGRAIQAQDWNGAARRLQGEMAVRRRITPQALDENTEALVEAAEKTGCGARFCGAGAGGSVWALGERENIDRLKPAWERMLAQMRGGRILTCRVESSGVR